jgi:hypothetical protein
MHQKKLVTDMKKLPKGFNHHKKYERTSIYGGIVSDEITCPHGVGHELGIHGCDGCCEKLRGYWGLAEVDN